MTSLQNFNSLVDQLEACSPSEKASIFLAKIVNQIREKGEDWINENRVALQILSDNSNNFCPVSDNRTYFISQFQLTLRTK
jgi:hypothetical protein